MVDDLTSTLELLLSRSRQPSNVSSPAAATSLTVRCRYPAVAGSSRARTLRTLCSLSSATRNELPWSHLSNQTGTPLTKLLLADESVAHGGSPLSWFWNQTHAIQAALKDSRRPPFA
jgi:hypothetical protein